VSALADVTPSDILAIEVWKPSRCPADLSVECPVIKVTVKDGREAAYRVK
jgi:hypothetical protein